MNNAARNRERNRLWANAYIAGASRFTASLFIGRGLFDNREAPTLTGARILAKAMLKEYNGKNYGRGVMIYAMTHDSLSIYVETLSERRARRRERL